MHKAVFGLLSENVYQRLIYHGLCNSWLVCKHNTSLCTDSRISSWCNLSYMKLHTKYTTWHIHIKEYVHQILIELIDTLLTDAPRIRLVLMHTLYVACLHSLHVGTCCALSHVGACDILGYMHRYGENVLSFFSQHLIWSFVSLELIDEWVYWHPQSFSMSVFVIIFYLFNVGLNLIVLWNNMP